jgi:fructose-1-phosphate kinase PfkB-like protein
MIAIIAGNYHEAETWARGQMLEDDEWFSIENEEDLLSRKGFHVIVVGTAGQNVPPSYFNKIFNLAQRRGRMR